MKSIIRVESADWRRYVILLLLFAGACLSLLLAAPLGERLAASRTESRDSAEMTFYPSGNFLKEMSLGHRHLVADIAWLSSIQYYGKHRLGDGQYAMSPELFRVITDADPAFENAYLFASLVMSEAGFIEQAERLLDLGVERNPNSWRLNFDLGFFHYVITHAWEKSASAFQAAADVENAPEYTRRFAAAAFEKSGDPATAKVLWQVIALESQNEEIRRMAEDRLAFREGDD